MGEIKYNHFRTNHMEQLQIRSICLGVVKAHDHNYITDEIRDEILANPKQAYQYPQLSEFIHQSFCGDVIHCDLKNNKSIDPFIKIHNHQKIEVYLRTKTWKEIRDNVLEQAKFICADCKHDFSHSKSFLQAHHKDSQYPTLYRESTDDLECVCKNCHAKGHGYLWMYSIEFVMSSN